MKKIFLVIGFLLAGLTLSAQLDTVNIGTGANNRTGDPLRTAFLKTNRAILQVNTLTSDTIDGDGVYVELADSAQTGGGYVTPTDLNTAISGVSGEDVELAGLAAMGATYKAFNVGGGINITSSGANLADRRCYFMAAYLQTGATLTGIRTYINTQGNYTPSDYNGIGLYSITVGAVADTLVLVASSTNDEADPNIWESTANVIISKDFSSTYVATAGLYYVAILYNQSAQTTAPQLYRVTNTGTAFGNTGFAKSHILCGYVDALTALPAKQILSGLTVAAPFWVGIY